MRCLRPLYAIPVVAGVGAAGDAPLLFEFKLDKICALSIVVAAAPETQLKRVIARDAIDEEAAKKRIAAQMPLALKLDRCDVALQNDTSKVALHALLDLLCRLTRGCQG